MYGTLLWATDGSALADLALSEALKVLEPNGRVVAFHCDQRFFGSRSSGEPIFADEPDQREAIHQRVDELKEGGIDIELVVSTTHHSPARAIVEAADEIAADAIVCGTRGLGSVQTALLGSVAKELLHISHVPLLVVPAKTRESTATAETSADKVGVS